VSLKLQATSDCAKRVFFQRKHSAKVLLDSWLCIWKRLIIYLFAQSDGEGIDASGGIPCSVCFGYGYAADLKI
jgi:hypothetical protein